MTKEELLRPRYKVIAKWPGMEAEPFHFDQIITLQRHVSEDGNEFIHVPIKHMPNSYMRQGFFDNYPHLFQPLQWWEERKPEDMPEYVKGDEAVFKAVWREGAITENGKQPMRMVIDEGYGDWQVISNVMCHFESATEEEYIQYKN